MFHVKSSFRIGFPLTGTPLSLWANISLTHIWKEKIGNDDVHNVYYVLGFYEKNFVFFLLLITSKWYTFSKRIT